MRALVIIALVSTALGCATIQPGHRGLYFEPSKGLHRDILTPGRHWVGVFGRIEDFDITYATHAEQIETLSQEGLKMVLRIALIYRPVASELYELETEIGPTYYDEVVGPEFRSVARGVAARHPYMELHRKNEQIEDEVEADLRRRTAGKHVEIASVTLESIQYEPAILKAVQDKLAAEQDSARQKTVLENEGMRKRLELQYQAEQEKMRADASLREKQRELELSKAQAETDRVKEESEAAKRVIQARGDAQAAKYSAQALSEREKAHNQALTPLAVMEKGFEALKALAGTGTNVMIGDWSKVPNFLFPGLNAFRASGAAGPGERHEKR
jgi:regulator of protease activity HflC (stomatin/prohibitin superfamily)